MDFSQYLEMFLEESKENLQTVNTGLLQLEAEPEDLQVINEIFRSAHTLKGMAASMGFEDLAALTHEMENVLDAVRNNRISAGPELMDAIFQSADAIEMMLNHIELGGDGKADVSEVTSRLSAILDGRTSSTLLMAEKEAAAAAPAVDQYQMTVIDQAMQTGHRLYSIQIELDGSCVMKSVRAYMVFQTAEELGAVISTNPSIEQIEAEEFGDSFSLLLLSMEQAPHIKERFLSISEVTAVTVKEQQVPGQTGDQPKPQAQLAEKTAKPSVQSRQQENKKAKSKSIRVDIEKLDQLMNLFSELIIDRGRLEQIASKAGLPELNETVEHMSRISTDLQSLILTMRMVPVEQVFNRFPRMIRDLSKELNKQVRLVIEGAETELDRTVIDEIGDPLVHLLRNALDHGLESSLDRLKANKPQEGTIHLKAHHSGNHVFIEVSDDGKGIDRKKVLAKAVERGIVEEEEAFHLSDQQVQQLLFSSGFSTASVISDISGRGVGLDVVKTKIESLGGLITIQSESGKGTTFRVQLPLTLSIIFAMLVKVEEEIYAVPFNAIVEIATAAPEDVETLHGNRVIQFRGQVITLVYLNEVFDVPPTLKEKPAELHLVLIRRGNETLGLVVDSVIGQQEVVIKPLGKFLPGLFAISGATILGNGEVALILDTNQFF